MPNYSFQFEVVYFFLSVGIQMTYFKMFFQELRPARRKLHNFFGISLFNNNYIKIYNKICFCISCYSYLLLIVYPIFVYPFNQIIFTTDNFFCRSMDFVCVKKSMKRKTKMYSYILKPAVFTIYLRAFFQNLAILVG